MLRSKKWPSGASIAQFIGFRFYAEGGKPMNYHRMR